MKVAVCSVPFTGTNFTATLFVNCGLERVGLGEELENSVQVGHCIRSGQCDLAKQADVLITPCRHPYLVEESYKRKGRDVAEMLSAFDNLISLNGLMLCVDSPLRAVQLERIKHATVLPLKTDWEVMSSKSQTFDINPLDLSPTQEIIDFCRERRDFFGRWYDLV